MALAFVGCLFVVKPGFHNAEFMSALIGVCGGLGAGIAYTMVRVLGTHGVKGPIIVILLFCFFMFVCDSVDGISFHTNDGETVCNTYDGRIICGRRTVYDHSGIHVCTCGEKFPFLIIHRLSLQRCWDFSCLEKCRINTALPDMR